MNPPACRGMGAHCRGVRVTVRVGETDDHEAYFDAVATWLLGHTERIEFGEIYDKGDDMLVDATVHVPCRYLTVGKRSARCQAHGYRTSTANWEPYRPANRQLGPDRAVLVTDNVLTETPLRSPARSLPVLGNGDNPCATASCRTSDNTRKAACCRDLILELDLSERARHREALLKSRKVPYVCEFDRTDEKTVEIHVISACSYLSGDGVTCVLHGKHRPSRRVAKPFLCTRWPDDPTNTHKACAFGKEA